MKKNTTKKNMILCLIIIKNNARFINLSVLLIIFVADKSVND